MINASAFLLFGKKVLFFVTTTELFDEYTFFPFVAD